MPEVRAEHLLSAAMTIGLATSNGFGSQRLTAKDIWSYIEVFKVDLTIWEAEALLKMSSTYVDASNEYDGVDVAPPTTQDIQNDRADISSKLLKAFVRRSQANKRSAPIGGRSNEHT